MIYANLAFFAHFVPIKHNNNNRNMLMINNHELLSLAFYLVGPVSNISTKFNTVKQKQLNEPSLVICLVAFHANWELFAPNSLRRDIFWKNLVELITKNMEN